MVSSHIAHIQCSVRFTHITPGHWTCSFMYHFNSLFGAHSTCSLFAATLPSLFYQDSFTPESSETCEGKLPCPRTQHRNDVLILRGEKHDLSLKILHQAGLETARQAVTLANICDLDIASPVIMDELWWILNDIKNNKEWGRWLDYHDMEYIIEALVMLHPIIADNVLTDAQPLMFSTIRGHSGVMSKQDTALKQLIWKVYDP